MGKVRECTLSFCKVNERDGFSLNSDTPLSNIRLSQSRSWLLEMVDWNGLNVYKTIVLWFLLLLRNKALNAEDQKCGDKRAPYSAMRPLRGVQIFFCANPSHFLLLLINHQWRNTFAGQCQLAVCLHNCTFVAFQFLKYLTILRILQKPCQ